jgi:hypothetical protein
MSDFLSNIDCTSVPDDISPPPPGLYELQIQGVPSVTRSKADKGTCIFVTFAVVNNEDEKLNGRMVQDVIYFDDDASKRERSLVKLKRLHLSAGLAVPQGDFDPSFLEDAIITAVLKEESYQDPDTGEKRSSTKVTRYVLPESPEE